MKWFQQNRALGTFLLLSGIGILLAAALLYWRFSVWSDARQTLDQATAERTRLQGLDPFPNQANYQKLQDHLERYRVALGRFKSELKNEMAPELLIAPNEFQSRLRQATVAATDRARTNHVSLPDKFQLGFDEFTRVMPDTVVSPLLGQELSQIQMLVNILLDAKVDGITAFHRHPLSQEQGATTPTPTPSALRSRETIATAKPGATPPPALIERNVVDIRFKAAPAVARKAINEITSSTAQFFIVRTLYVRNEKDKGPVRERGGASSPSPSPPASPGQSPPSALNFIVGNEHVEVSATIEMLRFTF
jgi:hypothetical protein